MKNVTMYTFFRVHLFDQNASFLFELLGRFRLFSSWADITTSTERTMPNSKGDFTKSTVRVGSVLRQPMLDGQHWKLRHSSGKLEVLYLNW